MRFLKMYLMGASLTATTVGFMVILIPTLLASTVMLVFGIDYSVPHFVSIVLLLAIIFAVGHTWCCRKYVAHVYDYRKNRNSRLPWEHKLYLLKVRKDIVIETGYVLFKDKGTEIIPVLIPRVLVSGSSFNKEDLSISCYATLDLGVKIHIRILFSGKRREDILGPLIGTLSAQKFYEEVVKRGFTCAEDWIIEELNSAVPIMLSEDAFRSVLPKIVNRLGFEERLPGICSVDIYVAV